MFRKIVSLVVLFTFIFYLISCTSTRYLTNEELTEDSEISVLHVKTKDGQQLKLNEPMIEGKLLSGYLEGVTYTEIDTSNVESMRIKKLKKGSTLFVGAVGVAAAILFLTSQGSSSDDCNT
jgi:hypothetical protein